MSRSPKISSPDEYLAALSAEKRVALERLRKAIRAAVPEAEECISYGLPAFRQNGKLLVAYGARLAIALSIPAPCWKCSRRS